MKICTRCKEVKSLDSFQNRKKNKDGKDSACRDCRRAADKLRYDSDPERRKAIRQHSERARVRNINWVWQYLLQNPCVDCGEGDPILLEFDHQGNKTRNISDMCRRGIVSLKTLQKEIEKCEVRCANCHRRKTAETLGWHKDIIAIMPG